MEDFERKHTTRVSRDCNESVSSMDSPAFSTKENRRHVNSEFDQEFINLEHIRDLARALTQDPYSGSEAGSEHITARRSMVPSRKRKTKRDKEAIGTPRGISYTLLRYPLMVRCFSSMIFFLFCTKH